MAFAGLSRGVPAALAAFLACVPAMAQSEPDFYAGKNLQVVIGVSAGGGYDTWGRIVARHIVRKLPGNPTAVPQNMPGAGSITAGNHIFNAAARDGTVIGILNRDAPLAPLTGSAAARFDATRFSWIGTPTVETNVCFVSSKASVRSIEDISKREVILGAVGPGSGSYNYPKALAGLLDLKIKLISGFPGSTDVLLAMERGEVDGMCESLDSVDRASPAQSRRSNCMSCFRAAWSRARNCRACLSSAISRAMRKSARRSNCFMRAKAWAAPSSPRRIW